jgi:hypothetical protein
VWLRGPTCSDQSSPDEEFLMTQLMNTPDEYRPGQPHINGSDVAGIDTDGGLESQVPVTYDPPWLVPPAERAEAI